MSFFAILSLAWSSLNNRRGSALLTVLAIAVAVMLFLGVDKLRESARESFKNTISGTDLIVGARTSPVSLVMFSVFHIGDPAANVTWDSAKWLSEQEEFEWTVPISLGDNHKGYRVIGTTADFFEHYAYRDQRKIEFSNGQPFDDVFDVVVGASVAKELGYSLDTEIVLSHGGGIDFSGGHDNLPFRIVGIMKPTGTPVDRSVLVSLSAIEAIHVGWETGSRSAVVRIMTPERVRKMDLSPDAVSAILVGLKGPNPFQTKRMIDTYRSEALIAAVPSLAIAEIWKLVGVVETVLLAVSAFVIVVGLISVLTSIMASLRERRREMAVLRAIGAGPRHIVLLLLSEAGLLAALGALLGIGFTYLAMAIASPIIETNFGLLLEIGWPGKTDMLVLSSVTGFSVLLGIIPAWQALQNSLADGLSIKL